MQLAGLILICAACPVITAMAESLQTVLLAHTVGLWASSILCRESRPQRPSLEREIKRARCRTIERELRTHQTAMIFSFFCIATALALLGALGGSYSLANIRVVLLDSYRPEYLDLLVGDGSILGVAAIVLLFIGCAASFGLFPMQGVLQNTFESSPSGIGGACAVFQRLQASIILWKIADEAMPGFGSTTQLMCIVFGVSSCLGGALLACRSESLRNFAGNLWIVWGGVGLIAAAPSVTAEVPANTQAAWQLPSGLETAAFSLVISIIAVGILLASERWLSADGRSIDFAEDVTGLGQAHRLIAFAIACSFLTFAAVPPLPGFWCAAFIIGNAFLPGVESAQGAALVPDTAILISTILLLISLLIVAARSIHLLSLIFHHEPIRQFNIPNRNIAAAFGLTASILLLWASLNTDTIFVWLHRFPL